MKRWKLVALAMTVVIAGCATPYKADGYGGGYSDVQLAEDTFRIAFKGNDATSRTRAEEFALLRAAEVTLAHGFRFFTLSDARSSLNYAGTVSSGGLFAAVNEPEVVFTITCYKEKPAGTRPPIDAELTKKAIAAKYGIRADIR